MKSPAEEQTGMKTPFLMSQEALSNLAYEFLRLNWDGNWHDLPQSWGLAELSMDERFERTFQILLAGNLLGLRCRYGEEIEPELQQCSNWKAILPSEVYMATEADLPGVIRLCACYHFQSLDGRPRYADTAAAQIVCSTQETAKSALVAKAGTNAAWGKPLAGFLAQE